LQVSIWGLGALFGGDKPQKPRRGDGTAPEKSLRKQPCHLGRK